MEYAISLLLGEKLYYYTAVETQMVCAGAEQCADIVIPEMKDLLTITCSGSEASFHIGKGQKVRKVKAHLDEFVTLDENEHLVSYVTQASSEVISLPIPDDAEITVGRNNRNIVEIRLPYIGRQHMKLICKNKTVQFQDCGSLNGTYHNGQMKQSGEMKDGDVLSVYTMRMRRIGDAIFFENTGGSVSLHMPKEASPLKVARLAEEPGATVSHRSAPRLLESIPSELISIEKPPRAEAKPQINWMNVLLMPAIMIIVMLAVVIVTGMNPVMLIMSAVTSGVSAITALVNYKRQQKVSVNSNELIENKYHAYLQSIRKKLERTHARQIDMITSANPDPQACVERALSHDTRLWERGALDRDFMTVRLGIGTVPSAVTAQYNRSQLIIEENPLEVKAEELAQSSRMLSEAPILCNLAESTIIGISGKQNACAETIRSILVGLCTAHTYEMLKIIALVSPSEREQWNWLRWLPHCQSEHGHAQIFCNRADAEELLDALDEMMQMRRSELENSHYDTHSLMTPHYLFLVSDPVVLGNHPLRKQLLGANQIGCSALFVADAITILPKECRQIIQLEGNRGMVFHVADTAQRTSFRPDRISVEKAECFARALAPLRVDREGAGSTIPDKISFLDGYGVSRPEELGIADRWASARTYKTLSVPIAARAGGTPFHFDIHEASHGVNGIVAGMPGSGKTEMVQSWLLSLAVHYSPQDVSFLLIDFKGSGMIAPFRKLPHLAGSISDLDIKKLGDSVVSRNLTSLMSEVNRREALLDRYIKEKKPEINRLNQGYAEGIYPEKLPILLVVIDEYAEFKKTYPEFGNQIDSLTSRGRSLGIWLVLMTQKPAGVVSAKSEDNINFRWCLRVANYNASRETLGRPDAARINRPGRAYIKVGEEKVYELVQSYWSNAPYMPERKVMQQFTPIRCLKSNEESEYLEESSCDAKIESDLTEIQAVVEHIEKYCAEHAVPNAQQIWMEQLPERFSLEQMQVAAYKNGMWPVKVPEGPAIGLVDDPDNQQQYPLVLDFARKGHTLIYGAPVAGKTTLLQTLVVSLARSFTPERVGVYIMDFGGGSLGLLKDFPHVAEVVDGNDRDRIVKLAGMLQDVTKERQVKFSRHGVSSINAFREDNTGGISDVVLVIDNLDIALRHYPELEEFFLALTAQGANLGIYLVAATSSVNGLSIKLTQNIKNSLALQLNEKSDYTYLVGKIKALPAAICGRGFIKGNPPLEFQTALPASGQSAKEIARRIRQMGEEMRSCWKGGLPVSIPEMPETIVYGSVPARGIALGLSCEKVAPVEWDIEKQHYLMISGTGKSGKSNLLRAISMQLKERGNGELYLFDIEALSGASQGSCDHYVTNAKESNAVIESLGPELEKRYAVRQSNPDAAFRPLILAIDNYSRFHSHRDILNETISRLHVIVKKCADLNVCLVMASDAYELSSLVSKGEYLALSMVKSQQCVLLGGCLNDHNAVMTKATYAQKNEMVRKNEGFYVLEGGITKFKAIKAKE